VLGRRERNKSKNALEILEIRQKFKNYQMEAMNTMN